MYVLAIQSCKYTVLKSAPILVLLMYIVLKSAPILVLLMYTVLKSAPILVLLMYTIVLSGLLWRFDYYLKPRIYMQLQHYHQPFYKCSFVQYWLQSYCSYNSSLGLPSVCFKYSQFHLTWCREIEKYLHYLHIYDGLTDTCAISFCIIYIKDGFTNRYKISMYNLHGLHYNIYKL